ncbi:MAG: TldD/PmbA family protein [Desulfomonilaceae bacterium]
MDDAVAFTCRLLEKQAVKQWEVFHQNSQSFRVEFKDGVMDTLQKARVSGLAVRVIKESKAGFSFTSALDSSSLQKSVDTALSMSQVMPSDPDAELAEPAPLSVLQERIMDDSLRRVTEVDKTEIARAIESKARLEDKRITTIRSAGYSDMIVAVRLVNSNGLDVNGEAGLVRAWVELMAEQNGEQEMAYWMEQARSPEKINPATVASEAAHRALDSLGGKSLPSAKMPVVVENSVAVDLLHVLSHSFLSENHFKKLASPRIKLGEPIFSRKISIVDDGLDARGDYAFPFDGEGTPSQRTHVVENGTLRSLLFDLSYARKLKASSTGNCRRGSFEGLPVNGVTNLLIEPGTSTREELTAAAGSGLLVTELMGLHTANPVSGDFSVGATGFKIKDGKLDHPVKGIAIAGNIVDLFGSVREVADDFRFFGNMGAPSLLVEALSVSGL